MEIQWKLMAMVALTCLLTTGHAESFDPAELDDENRGENWLAYGRTHS